MHNEIKEMRESNKPLACERLAVAPVPALGKCFGAGAGNKPKAIVQHMPLTMVTSDLKYFASGYKKVRFWEGEPYLQQILAISD